ncbi:DUF3800 domain-containing protein [Azospirillum thiophilum]|uniref:DUF3800 domain-containing protein n=1 Tax=Azospirillum thiophilum TaxID=528244 RepID=UPI0009E272F5|nr:DUF3800 domain-containing protein [Azospirillum thiophilum]
MTYRMYVDEVGNSKIIDASKPGSQSPENRYLSLTGVITKKCDIRPKMHSGVSRIKTKYFHDDPDDHVILHRREISRQSGHYEPLKDADTRLRFHSDVRTLISWLPITVITAVMDKFDKAGAYPEWSDDPYHVTFTNIVERFFLFLQGERTTGDIVIEARNGDENSRLSGLYAKYRINGLHYISASDVRKRFPSERLMIKDKKCNIAGLQIADLVANPSHIYCLSQFAERKKIGFYEKQIIDVLVESKYRRSNDGDVLGFGVKWIPDPKS